MPYGIYERTEENRKASEARKGIPRPDWVRQKISRALKGRKTPWLYGNKNPMANPETRKKWEEASNNKDYPTIVKKQRQTSLKRYGVENYSFTEKFKNSIAREKHPNWKGGVTSERFCFYAMGDWKNMAKFVRKRDKYICQNCDGEENGIPFHVHHMVSFATKELRLNPDNLVLVCKKCHNWIHSKKNISREFLERGEIKWR